jgi:hypothetical protein
MISTDFPEDIFQPSPRKASSYKYMVNVGEKICKDKKILFCGICRNVGDVLERNILCLHRTGGLFKDFKIFMYENDSSDKTIDILNQYKSAKLDFITSKRDDKDYRINLNNGSDPWHFQRCKILADCRNNYLEFAKNFYHFDYLCVVDIDIAGAWSYDGIKHAIFILEHNQDYGCVSSYGVLADSNTKNNTTLEDVDQNDYIMYDSLAFRPITVNNVHMSRLNVFGELNFSRGDDPLEVNSNFGGMAIYKMNLIKDKIYDAKEWASGYTDPDHVIFNRQIQKDGYKIILNPNMITSYSHHRYSK